MDDLKQLILLGVDTGGTFTDFVFVQHNTIRIHKVLSTPKAPEQAILKGIDDLGIYTDATPKAPVLIVHGSTVATNAVLEGKGVRTVFITNYGLRDILTIGRQARRELYNLQPLPPNPPVSRDLCLETGGRISSKGELVQPLTEDELTLLADQIRQLAPQAVAINLLFSFIDDRYEKAIAKIVPETIFVSLSSQVLPEYKEYERGITTWLNASVGPIVKNYLANLCRGIAQRESGKHTTAASTISVMQSSGGTMDAAQAADQAVHMLLSGPAGGLSAAQYIATQADHKRLLSFDMGGTSTDVALIDGELQLTHEGRVGYYPVGVPMVDMHTIGAGGGSVASVDAGGLLQVGPESAGADPGPACYGLGGTFATVTDANVVLGRIRPDYFLGGNMLLDRGGAFAAVEKLAVKLSLTVAETANGIIQLVNEHMARALRVMSVQRGIDPKQLTLVSFGGAGALHVCALAQALNMRRALVPINAGVLSALGMLTAARCRHFARSINIPLLETDTQLLEPFYHEMITQGRAALSAEGVEAGQIRSTKKVDLRYQGQSACLTLDWVDNKQLIPQFHAQHAARYGHQLDLPIELVAIRLKVEGPQPQIQLTLAEAGKPADPLATVPLQGISDKVPLYERSALRMNQQLEGPALIVELVSTTYVASGWSCKIDKFGNLILTV